ncbi:MAG TPA: hypothetical protein VGI98_06110 [Candidatus Limnocylindrales bacterium]
MAPRSSLAAALAVLLLVAACGGSGSAAPGSSNAGAGPGGTSAAQASQPSGGEPTDSAAQPTDDTGTGSNGSFTGSACDLLTTAEVETASGRPNITTAETKAGDFDGQAQCGYTSNGLVPVAIVTVLNANADVEPDAMLTMPQSKLLTVNGAKAYWVPAAGFEAFVVKHGLIVAIAAIGPGDAISDASVMAQALVQPLADRMP